MYMALSPEHFEPKKLLPLAALALSTLACASSLNEVVTTISCLFVVGAIGIGWMYYRAHTNLYNYHASNLPPNNTDVSNYTHPADTPDQRLNDMLEIIDFSGLDK